MTTEPAAVDKYIKSHEHYGYMLRVCVCACVHACLRVCVCYVCCRLTKGIEEQARVEHERGGGPAHQQETRYDDHHTLYNDIEVQSHL